MRSKKNMMFLVVIVSAFFAMLFRWCIVNFVSAYIGETNTTPESPPETKQKQ